MKKGRKSSWPHFVRGDVIAQWRKELGISQRKTALLLNISITVLRYSEDVVGFRNKGRLWREAHPGKASEYSREWSRRNKEKVQIRNRIWSETNLEKVKEYSHNHYLKNKEIIHRRARKWEKDNAERYAVWRRTWRKEHIDKFRKQDRLWRRNNLIKARAIAKKWRDTHPEIVRAVCRNRRARKLGAGGIASAETVLARVEYYGGLCAYCKVAPYEHIDHVIPLSRGGTNWPANLRPACAVCNLSKSARTPREWKCVSGI